MSNRRLLFFLLMNYRSPPTMSSRCLHSSLLSSAKSLASSPISRSLRTPIPLPPPARQASWTTRNDKGQQRHGAFDPSLPFVEYESHIGPDRGNVIVSEKTKPETLTAALSPLLALPSGREESSGEKVSFGSMVWRLTKNMNSISRPFSFENEADAASFVEAVSAAAEEINHHPDIIKRRYKTDTYVVISCSTHHPPGMSMRDVRLAKKINELAATYGEAICSNSNELPRKALYKLRRSLIRELGKQGKESAQTVTSETPD